ncbi:MAG: AarF/ABC1/UbiB kinase family protein [Clostridia bacterium]|nr:AarF/ABC1/UbiB kinase family protein [Clostridia bacterium]
MRNDGTETSARSNHARIHEILGILVRRGVLSGMTPEKLRLVIEDMGPGFVKLGQMLSMRRDILSAEYCEELSRLRTDVRSLDFDAMRGVIEEEYGVPIERRFSSFTEEPVGSASIAQVYPAVTNGGSRVVVKVQRPGIRDAMRGDIELLKRLTRLLSLNRRTGGVFDIEEILDELLFAAEQETDFIREADNMREFAELNRDVHYIAVPKVYKSLTTQRVIVMEQVDGIKIDNRRELIEAGYDLKEIGHKLASNYIKQMFTDGFFHADPHPGNLYIRDGQIVYIDMGMMGRLSERDRRLFRSAVFAIVENDAAELKNLLLLMGTAPNDIDHSKLLSDVGALLSRYAAIDMGSINVGQAVEDFVMMAGSYGITMSRGITLMGRGLLTLEGVLAQLSPDISILNVAAEYMQSDIIKDIDVRKTLMSLAKSAYYTLKKAEGIPVNTAELLRLALMGEAKINIKNTEGEEYRREISRGSGRIAAAVAAAGLFIAASILCFSPLPAVLWGMSVPTLVGYAMALLLMIRVIRR